MGKIFNSPPGWPKPPEGWTPPPGWSPNASWPAAPDGWEFWIDDPFAAAVAAEHTVPSQQPVQPSQPSQPVQQPGMPTGHGTDPQPTQAIGMPPTQAMPQQPAQPGLYSYAPSGGLEQPGASPYGPQGAPQQGYGSGGYAGGPYSSPGAPTPKPRNTTMIIVVGLVAVLVVAGLVWGLTSLLGGGDEEPTAGSPTTTTEPTDDPTTDPTDDPTTPEPTDDPTTTEPTDDPTDNGGAPATFVDLTGGEPALVYGSSGEPVVEVRLVETVPNWESSEDLFICSEPDNGQHLGVNLEFTILPAMADEDEPSYTFAGLELGALVDETEVETNALLGLFCVGSSESAPSDMQPGQTYTGWSVLDVPEDVTAVTFGAFFDFTGNAPVYRWVLADQ